MIARTTRRALSIRQTFPPIHSRKVRLSSCRTNINNGSTIHSYFSQSLFSRPVPVSYHQPTESSSSSLIFISLVGLTIGAGYLTSSYFFPTSQTTASPKNPTILDEQHTSYATMTAELQPGRPGNLTAEQEVKLKEMWTTLLKLFGILKDGAVAAPPPTATSTAEPKSSSRFSLFGKKKEESNTSSGNEADNDKHGLNQTYKEALAENTPEELRDSFWGMVKHDNPDALLLRFLRARKWDVNAAVIMMISALQWRTKDMHVDDEIMLQGEGHALAQTQSSDAAEKKKGEDLMSQLRKGKSFLYGTDVEGRPCCYVRVRLHRAGEQSVRSLEVFTVYLIETARLELRPPIDTATIVFDMTGFSMANMDYTPVKFMIKCFEANYPESLGSVLIYKSPWIFQGIWKIIRGWLDPVVAGKVHFVNNVDDLTNYIPRDQIIKELDGPKSYEYKYVEPVDGENKAMDDTATRDKIEDERKDLAESFESSTLTWLGKESTSDSKKDRESVIAKFAENYWRLDPYVRARSLYDRTGVISEGGKLDFYPKTAT